MPQPHLMLLPFAGLAFFALNGMFREQGRIGGILRFLQVIDRRRYYFDESGRMILVEETRRVRKPVGFLLARWALVLFSRKTLEMVILPVIADMQYEYLEALKAAEQARKERDLAELRTQMLRASVVRVRGIFSLVLAVLSVLTSSVGEVVKFWKSAR